MGKIYQDWRENEPDGRKVTLLDYHNAHVDIEQVENFIRHPEASTVANTLDNIKSEHKDEKI